VTARRRLATALAFAIVACSAVGVASPPTILVLLGTGTPNADPDRSGPAVAIVTNGTAYLVDFGPGVVRRAAAAERKGVAALAVKNLRRAFVTHLHSDHTAGYADLIFTPWVLERDVPLEVYGPPGLKSMTRHLLAAYREDVRVRLDGLEPANTEGYKVRAHDVRPGVIYRDPNVTVNAFGVRHGSWRHAYGYRFQTADRTIVISGDAAPSESVVAACGGCDVLVHEVYSEAGFRKRRPEWQRYHAAFHTSSRQLGELARRARPKLLVLYHQLLWDTTPEDLLKEIAEVYPGKVVFGNDLDVF
jgi:ribonuclease BN (tRNA processing enzyme)